MQNISLSQDDIKVNKANMDNQSLIDMCTKKLEQDPHHKKALILRASSLIKKGDLKLALKDALKLIDLDNRNSATFYLIGCIYEKMGNLELSLQYLNRSLDFDPNNVNALFSRGACYNKLGNYEKAVDDYYLAIEKDSLKTNKRPNIRNIQTVLGLNKEKENNDEIAGENNEKDDVDNYIYAQLNERGIISKQLYEDLISSNLNSKSNNFNNKKELINNSKDKYGYKTEIDNLDKFLLSNNDNIPLNNIKNHKNSPLNIQISVNNQNHIAQDKDKDKKKKQEPWELLHAQGYAARKKENYNLAIDYYTKSLELKSVETVSGLQFKITLE